MDFSNMQEEKQEFVPFFNSDFSISSLISWNNVMLTCYGMSNLTLQHNIVSLSLTQFFLLWKFFIVKFLLLFYCCCCCDFSDLVKCKCNNHFRRWLHFFPAALHTVNVTKTRQLWLRARRSNYLKESREMQKDLMKFLWSIAPLVLV